MERIRWKVSDGKKIQEEEGKSQSQRQEGLLGIKPRTNI